LHRQAVHRETKIMRAFLPALCILLFSGCTHMHLARVPPQLHEQPSPVTRQDIESHSYKLQIIVTRHPIYFTHSALRLIDGQQLLFWDPAGTFGLTEEYPAFYKQHPLPAGFSKRNDLIVDGVPDLSLYWAYAQQTGDEGMEVLEWNLTPAQAAHYYDVLLTGAEGNEQTYHFTTKHHFLLCSSNLSRFLVRFTGDSVGLKETCFFPDSLAHALYKLNPDRVIFFDEEEGVRIFSKQGHRQ
jgi:hypothetical protein